MNDQNLVKDLTNQPPTTPPVLTPQIEVYNWNASITYIDHFGRKANERIDGVKCTNYGEAHFEIMKKFMIRFGDDCKDICYLYIERIDYTPPPSLILPER